MIQLMKFGIVGVANTLITIISYNALVYLGLNYMVSNVVGYALGVLNSFYWNKNWVFKAGPEQKHVFSKFVVVNLITLGVNTLILFGLVELMKIRSFPAQFAATMAGLLLNFILNKKWTFKQRMNVL
jgi:putative flippase GtrA